MKKHLYEIKRLDIPAYLRWWLIKKKFAGTLSEVMENLTSPITLTDSLKRRFKIFQIGGNSVQDGEPSPTNKVPIQNVTGEIEVKVENKNLAPNNEISNLLAYANTIYPNATGESKKWIDNIINLPKDTEIISSWEFSSDGTSTGDISGKRIAIYYTDNTSQITTKGIKFTIPSEKTISFIIVYGNTNATSNKWTNIQFEYGSVTTYVPHEEQTVTFPLSEGQVLHEGDPIEDKIVQRRKTIIFNGTENWQQFGNNVSLSNWDNKETPNHQNSTLQGYLCNIALEGIASQTENNNQFGTYNWGNVDWIVFNINTIVAEWKAYLAEQYANNTPVTVEYELETPIEIPFTQAQATAKAQIDKLYSYKGTTHISSDNEPSPTFTIQYVEEEE